MCGVGTMRTTLVLALVLIASAALGSEVPRIDVEASCRAAPRLFAQDQNPYDQCMIDEVAARLKLEGGWASYKAEHRDLCFRETHDYGSPSYVDVLTCL